MENITVADLARELGASRNSLKSFIKGHDFPVIVTRIKDTRGPQQITLPPESADLLRMLYTNTKNKVHPSTYTYGKIITGQGHKMEAAPRTFVCPICDKEFTSPRSDRTYCSRECYTKKRREIRPSPPEKPCRTCGNLLPIGEYYVDSLGPINTCKACHGNLNRTRYRTNLRSRLLALVARAEKRARGVKHRRKVVTCSLALADLETAYEKQDGLCFYTKQPLSLKTGDDSISLDRRDPSKPYSAENIVLTSWRVNRIKSDLPEGEFYRLCRLITENAPPF